jgi:hypothetical protein
LKPFACVPAKALRRASCDKFLLKIKLLRHPIQANGV